MIKLAELGEFLQGFSFDMDPATVAKTYKKKLAHLPVDLLVDAIDGVTSEWRSRKAPLPAHFTNEVLSELERRKQAKWGAEKALEHLNQAKPVEKEYVDMAEFDALMDKHKAWVKSRSMR
jgi:hypothetical protein